MITLAVLHSEWIPAYSISFVVIWWFILNVVIEGVRAAAAVSVGLRIPLVTFGCGREWRRWKQGDTTFVLRVLPFVLVRVHPRCETIFRVRARYLGCMGATWVMVLALYFLVFLTEPSFITLGFPTTFDLDWQDIWRGWVAFMLVIYLATTSRHYFEDAMPDPLWFYHTLTSSAEEAEEFGCLNLARRAEENQDAVELTRWMNELASRKATVYRGPLLVGLAGAQARLGNIAGVRAAAGEITTMEMLDLVRAYALDSLACIPLHEDLPELLDEALVWSDRSVRLAPENQALLGTKGALLVELGRLDEARPILREAFSNMRTSYGRRVAAAYLARLAANDGDRLTARKMLEEAEGVKTGDEKKDKMLQRVRAATKELLGERAGTR